jgi:hypothetical protein
MSALALLWTPIEIGPLKLFRLRRGSVEREASMNACRQAIAGKGCFAVAMIAFRPHALGDGGFGYRRLHWEAGAIGQALYLWSAPLASPARGGCFFDDEIHAMLGLSRAAPFRTSPLHRRRPPEEPAC